MRAYEVWIYDSESGCDQPMRCKARNKTEARRMGREYIRRWKLVGGTVTKVREAVTDVE